MCIVEARLSYVDEAGKLFLVEVTQFGTYSEIQHFLDGKEKQRLFSRENIM